MHVLRGPLIMMPATTRNLSRLHPYSSHIRSLSLLILTTGVCLFGGCNHSGETVAGAGTSQPRKTHPSEIFLSDLSEREVVVSVGEFGKNGECGYNGRKIIVNGRFAAKGVSTHCMEGEPVGVSYDVPAGVARLVTAGAIIDDVATQVGNLSTAGSPIHFRVLGDAGKILWDSPVPIREIGQIIPCDVSVVGQKSIRLEASCDGSSNWCCFVWLNPYFTADPAGDLGPLRQWLEKPAPPLEQ